MHNDGLSYTSLKGNTEFFTVTKGTGHPDMGHEDLVDGRRPQGRASISFAASTDIFPALWMTTGLLIARQATLRRLRWSSTGRHGHPSVQQTTLRRHPHTRLPRFRRRLRQTAALVGHAIATNDFASSRKATGRPAMVVNSPGNRILTRDEGVFTAMREDKLKYTSGESRSLTPSSSYDDLAIHDGPRRHRHGKRPHGRPKPLKPSLIPMFGRRPVTQWLHDCPPSNLCGNRWRCRSTGIRIPLIDPAYHSQRQPTAQNTQLSRVLQRTSRL